MRLNPFLDCREAMDLLGEDFERVLPPGRNLQLRLHMLLCRHCRRYGRTYRKTADLVRALRNWEGLSESATIPDELVRSLVTEARELRDDSMSTEDMPDSGVSS